MKTLTIIVVSMLACIVSRAEDFPLVRETIAYELQMRQKPGTEQLLANYLRNLPTESDTIYAILYEPTLCPRCEMAVKPFFEQIKAISPHNATLLITAYNDSARAAAYNQEKGYVADCHIYDTDNDYLSIFSFNTNTMAGLYLLKMCRSRGELIVGVNSFYISMEYVRQFVGWTERVETKDFAWGEDGTDANDWQLPLPLGAPLGDDYTDYPLACGGQNLSDVYGKPMFDDGHFAYNDKLNNCIMLFGLGGDTLRFRSRVEADSAEMRSFIHISESDYNNIKNTDLFYIPLTPAMTDSQHLGVSYSLPLAMEDTISKDGSIALFNSPVVLMRDINTLEHLPLYCPDFMLFEDSFFYEHFNFTKFKDDIIFGCMKLTFPMEYEREEYEHIPTMNPFCSEFYRSSNPWLAAFDMKTGKLRKRFADLEPIAETGRTGYYYSNYVAYSDDHELLYCDGYSGAIHITDDIDSGRVQTYYAFAVDTAAFPPLDTAKYYKREYFRSYDRYYYRTICDARMTADKICCIVKYAKGAASKPSDKNIAFAVVTIDRHTGLATECRMPPMPGMRPLAYGVRTAKGRVSPYVFARRDDGSHVVRVWQ